MRKQQRIGLLVLSVLLMAGGVAAQEGDPPKTGTDPRDFSSKFSPYFMYTELENDLQQSALVMSGLWAFSPTVALLYEIPIAFERDFGETALFDPTTGNCGPGVIPGGGVPLPNNVPLFPERDCQEVGTGDAVFQLLLRGKKALGGDWVFGVRFDVPMASKDELGSETFTMSPIVAYVRDLKIPGAFVAFMNLYKFDVWKDSNRSNVSAYVGRWFLMLPLSKKLRLYALPEFQPIYDFENKHFSFWAAPEIGHLLGPGNILYLKPGWGVDPDELQGDRRFTLEVGWRKFL